MLDRAADRRSVSLGYRTQVHGSGSGRKVRRRVRSSGRAARHQASADLNPVPPGRTPSLNESSDRFVESVSITLSSSANGTYGGSYATISSIIMGLALLSASEKIARYRDPPSRLISDPFAQNRWSVGCTIGIFVKRLRAPAFFVGFPRAWCLVRQSARRCPRLPFSSADNEHRHRMHGLAAYPGVSFRSWAANDAPLFSADGISRRDRCWES